MTENFLIDLPSQDIRILSYFVLICSAYKNFSIPTKYRVLQATSSKKTKRQKRAEKKAEEEYLYQVRLKPVAHSVFLDNGSLQYSRNSLQSIVINESPIPSPYFQVF